MALKENDLAGVLLPKLSIDEFEPKTGEKEDISVLGFYVKEESAGEGADGETPVEGAEAASKEADGAKKDDKTKDGDDKKPDEKKPAEKKPAEKK